MTKAKRITITALFTAIIFVTTSFIKFPISLGYVHVGDVFILLGSFMLPLPFIVLASAIGSMLADLLAGYVIYMPITFLAKGLMALIASLLFYKKTTILRYVIGALVSSLVMVCCYFVFEGFVYGWGMAIANLPMQFIQPAIAIVLGGIMIVSCNRISYFNNLKDEIMLKPRSKVSKKVK